MKLKREPQILHEVDTICTLFSRHYTEKGMLHVSPACQYVVLTSAACEQPQQHHCVQRRTRVDRSQTRTYNLFTVWIAKIWLAFVSSHGLVGHEQDGHLPFSCCSLEQVDVPWVQKVCTHGNNNSQLPPWHCSFCVLYFVWISLCCCFCSGENRVCCQEEWFSWCGIVILARCSDRRTKEASVKLWKDWWCDARWQESGKVDHAKYFCLTRKEI